MLESTFDTKFIQWIKEDPDRVRQYSDAGLIETKVAKGGTFNLKQWRTGKQSDQVVTLHNVETEVGFIWKISDVDRRKGKTDIVFTFEGVGLLVIYFDDYKEFFMIPIHQVPADDSIAYTYCKEHFVAHTLGKSTKEVVIYDI
jgi:hypothetical protein